MKKMKSGDEAYIMSLICDEYKEFTKDNRKNVIKCLNLNFSANSIFDFLAHLDCTISDLDTYYGFDFSYLTNYIISILDMDFEHPKSAKIEIDEHCVFSVEKRIHAFFSIRPLCTPKPDSETQLKEFMEAFPNMVSLNEKSVYDDMKKMLDDTHDEKICDRDVFTAKEIEEIERETGATFDHFALIMNNLVMDIKGTYIIALNESDVEVKNIYLLDDCYVKRIIRKQIMKHKSN